MRKQTPKDHKIAFSVELDPATMSQLEAAAAKEFRTRAAMARLIIKKYLEKPDN